MAAGSNEKKFIDLVKEKYNIDLTKTKKRFTNDDSVEISVDASYINKSKKKQLLIEVDSGNMAKLLVGQYVLINELLNKYKFIFRKWN